MRLAPGHVIDRYTVERLLGSGGMAEVYLVRHNTLGSPHALKVLSHAGPSVHDRLIQEGRVQANLRHPNIVAVTDVLEVGGAPALLMEFVEGQALDEWLQVHEPTLDQALYIFNAILDGVEEAHTVGVAHRDLKPANVMISARGVPKVADFGLAKALATEQQHGHTRTGSAMGTPAYMAPEQIRNAKDTDTRADIFALGCILYELVCHQQAFEAPDLLSLFNKVATGDSADPLLLRPDLPQHVVQALRGSMEVERDARIQDVQGLRSVLNGESTWTRPAPAVTLHADGRASVDNPPAARPPPTLVQRPELAADSKASFGDVLLPEPEEPEERRLPWGRIAIGVGLTVLGLGALGMAATGALGVAFWQTNRLETPVQVRDVVEPAEPQAEEPAPSQVLKPSEPTVDKTPEKAPEKTPEKASKKPSAAQGGKVPVLTPSVTSQPPAETPKPAATGTVTMTGADSIVLYSNGYRGAAIHDSKAASVPAGTYTVSARWGGHASGGAGQITVVAGKTVNVVCDPDFLICEPG